MRTIFTAIVAILLFLVAGNFVSHQFERCKFEIVEMRLKQLSLTRATIELTLKIVNPSDIIPAFASRIEYAVVAGTDTVGIGEMKGPIKVMPQDSSVVKTSIIVRNGDVLRAIINGQETGYMEMQVYILSFLGVDVVSHVSVKIGREAAGGLRGKIPSPPPGLPAPNPFGGG